MNTIVATGDVVGFNMTVYEVCEADEVVIVCAVVVAPLGPCPFDEFEVQLISEDGTASMLNVLAHSLSVKDNLCLQLLRRIMLL